MRSRILHGWLLIAAGECRRDAARGRRRAAPDRLGAAARTHPGPRHPRHRHRPVQVPGRGRRRARPNCAGWPARSTRWPTTSRTSWSSSGPSSPTPRTSCATRCPRCCCASSCSASNCPSGTRRSPPCRPRASGWPGCWTICSTWRWPSTPPADLQLTDIAELAAERVDGLASGRRAQGRAAGVGRARRPLPAGPTRWRCPARWTRSSTTPLKFTPEGEHVDGARSPSDGEPCDASSSPTAGPGLTEEELARIGDRFWRSSRHQNITGSGLGLSISRALLAAGGGTIAYAPPRAARAAGRLTVPRTKPQ